MLIAFAYPPAASARRRQAARTAAPLRFAPSGASAVPIRRFASMVFGERSRPLEPAPLTKDHGSQRPEPRAGVKAREATVQRLDLDAEHGSGSRDLARPTCDNLWRCSPT